MQEAAANQETFELYMKKGNCMQNRSNGMPEGEATAEGRPTTAWCQSHQWATVDMGTYEELGEVVSHHWANSSSQLLQD